jgi:ABC-type polysaccharide/polyol phosphate transport system ATPase subunit/SAM-dependent methyltransferase
MSAELKVKLLGLLDLSRRQRVEEFWALRSVSLKIRQGDSLGLIGRNGSGKSTFLKLVAGIHRPTTGDLLVAEDVRIGSMIELGTGFHPELTGQENVLLNTSIHGLSRAEALEVYEAVVSYSGLRHFMDVPLKNYSSGMHMRLGFAIAANLDPDVLLLDEIFAVGDEAFQQQCVRTMQQFRADGRTILFVSHSMSAIRSVCDRVCLLDRGRLLFDGEAGRGLEEYRRLLSAGEATPAPQPEEPAHEGGWHRVVPGNYWAEGGEWAFDLLRREGLRPADFVLDVGCGSLAAGRHLLPYLDPARYFGFDVNQALLLAGVSLELPRAGTSDERGCFIYNHEFDLSLVPATITFAVAEGFFSRLPLNRIARCVGAVLGRLAPGGRFYATWFDNPDAASFEPIDRGGYLTYSDAEPYHYSFAVLQGICSALGARATPMEAEAGRAHPRGERVMVITRDA